MQSKVLQSSTLNLTRAPRALLLEGEAIIVAPAGSAWTIVGGIVYGSMLLLWMWDRYLDLSDTYYIWGNSVVLSTPPGIKNFSCEADKNSIFGAAGKEFEYRNLDVQNYKGHHGRQDEQNRSVHSLVAATMILWHTKKMHEESPQHPLPGTRKQIALQLRAICKHGARSFLRNLSYVFHRAHFRRFYHSR